MSTRTEPIPTPPTSAMRNTVGKGNEQTLENPNRHASNSALREYCDKHYHQLLPLIAEKEETQRSKKFHNTLNQEHRILEGNPEGGEGLDAPGFREENGVHKVGKKEKRRNQQSGGVKEDVCPHTRMTPDPNGTGTPKEKRRAATRVSIQGKQNPFPESVTTKEVFAENGIVLRK
ncbi:hypothetical protein Tco_0382911 [Tanacetum coccineum]